MQLLEVVTLNITNIELIIGIIMMVGGLFGAPYVVRSQNKKMLDSKVNTCDFEAVKKEVDRKAGYKYVDEHINELKNRHENDRIEMNRKFEIMDGKIDKILTILIDKK